MRKYEPGTRVAAVLDADDDEIRFFGYGIYIGDEVPPEDVKGLAEYVREMGQGNPRINLDGGGYVFGCECWWMDELQFLEWAGLRKITTVRPDRTVTPEA